MICSPSLSKERRFESKVDALNALCEWSKPSLTSTAATRRRLLDALLGEALSPTTTQKREAAE